LWQTGLILASPSVKDKVLPECRIDWSAHAIDIELFRGECCEMSWPGCPHRYAKACGCSCRMEEEDH